MPEQDPRTTGTTSGAVGDGGQAPQAGTTPAAGRNAAEAQPSDEEIRAENARLKAAQAQWLAEKASYERLKAEAAGGATPPTPQPSGSQDLARSYMELQQAAAAGDSYAQYTLGATEHLYAKLLEQERRLERLGIPEAEREEVEREFGTGNYRTYEAARKAARAVKLEAEREQWEKQRRSIEEANKARQDGTTTYTRPVSASEMGAAQEMTRDEYLKRMNSDELSTAERLRLRREKDAGKIKLTG